MPIRPFLHLEPPGSFTSFSEVTSYARRLWDALYKLRRGKIECVLTVTLTANAASTVVIDERLSIQTAMFFDPTTANAATELANGTLYALTANRGTGTWTLTHANNAQADRTYQVALIG